MIRTIQLTVKLRNPTERNQVPFGLLTGTSSATYRVCKGILGIWVVRESSKRKISGRDTGLAKISGCGLGKKTVFIIKMTEARKAGL